MFFLRRQLKISSYRFHNSRTWTWRLPRCSVPMILGVPFFPFVLTLRGLNVNPQPSPFPVLVLATRTSLYFCNSVLLHTLPFELQKEFKESSWERPGRNCWTAVVRAGLAGMRVPQVGPFRLLMLLLPAARLASFVSSSFPGSSHGWLAAAQKAVAPSKPERLPKQGNGWWWNLRQPECWTVGIDSAWRRNSSGSLSSENSSGSRTIWFTT